MNISTAFSYVKNDKDWITKLLVAGLISLIPIVGALYLTGWFMEIARRVYQKHQDILPEASFGPFISLGFKAIVVSFVYTLPITLIMGFLTAFTTAASSSGSEGVQFIGAAFSCVTGLISFVLGLFISVFILGGIMRVIKYDSIKEGLNFSAVWKMITGNLQTLIILFLLDIAVSFIGSIGAIFCFIGILFTMPYAMAVWGYLNGDAMNEFEAKGLL